MNHVVTGYLPSVILMLFLYTVPPMMMLFSSVEGHVSRSGRKRSAGLKVLYFTIWNVFFVNVLSGSIISQLNVFSSVRDIPTQLAKAIPTQVTFLWYWIYYCNPVINVSPLRCLHLLLSVVFHFVLFMVLVFAWMCVFSCLINF